MQSIINSIVKNRNLIIYLFLLFISFNYLYNNSAIHYSGIGEIGTFISGSTSSIYSYINSYFNLRQENNKLIEEYKEYHAKGNAWPEITKSIKVAGIVDMEIYLVGNRLFMIMEVDETFNKVKKAKMDAANPKVQKWEKLMWNYQQALPWAKDGEKWMEMEQVFKLE